MDKREYIFQYVPKLGVEIIAVCALVGMCSYLLWEGKSQQEITYMLGLMATAGFRLIPSFSRIPQQSAESALWLGKHWCLSGCIFFNR